MNHPGCIYAGFSQVFHCRIAYIACAVSVSSKKLSLDVQVERIDSNFNNEVSRNMKYVLCNKFYNLKWLFMYIYIYICVKFKIQK